MHHGLRNQVAKRGQARGQGTEEQTTIQILRFAHFGLWRLAAGFGYALGAGGVADVMLANWAALAVRQEPLASAVWVQDMIAGQADCALPCREIQLADRANLPRPVLIIKNKWQKFQEHRVIRLWQPFFGTLNVQHHRTLLA